MKQIAQKILIIVLVVAICVPLGQAIVNINPAPSLAELTTQYRNSQYCLAGYRLEHATDVLTPAYARYCGDGSIFAGNIDDPELYTLAGWEYIHGADPSAINFEVQPATKYIFGVSMLAFGTPMVVQWLLAGGILVVTYAIAATVLPPVWALVPVMALAWDGLFRGEMAAPYVDLGTTCAIVLFLLFLTRTVRSHKGMWSAMIALGVVTLTKSFSIGIVAAGAAAVWLFFVSKQSLDQFLRSLWLTVLTYLAGYVGFFLHHPNPLDFVRLHVNIVRLYKSYVPNYPKFEVFHIIFTGRWREWYGSFGLARVPEWSLLWPLSVFSAAFLALSKRLHNEPAILLHLVWIALYLIMVSLRLVFPRYLVLVLPSLYVVGIYTARQLISICYSYSYGRGRRH